MDEDVALDWASCLSLAAITWLDEIGIAWESLLACEEHSWYDIPNN